jgi:A/G-specific adenine glycosylase
MRSALLSWYDDNHRILPWRRNSHSRLSPETVTKAAQEGSLPAPLDLSIDRFIYYVWVCEIMSQQTQVSRAAEYFRKWVAKWPDVVSLAAATQEEVNELWAGLGYYRRARFLLDGAKYIVNDLDGHFPQTAKELMKIPGVGAYTSNAIASIACGEQVAVVDGNVIRVMSRLRQLGGDPKSAAMTKLFADVAQQALDPERPGDFNQAVMELGATVCVPNTQPSCIVCPVKDWCSAHKAEKEGTCSVVDYPTKVEKAEKREEHVAVAVVRVIPEGTKPSEKGAGKYLLVKRPPGGLLAGLWEFPLQPVDTDSNSTGKQDVMNDFLSGLLGEENLAEKLTTGTVTAVKKDAPAADENEKGAPAAAEAAADAATSTSSALRIVERKSVGEVIHVFSHIRMTMHVEAITFQGAIPEAVQTAAAEGEDGPTAANQAEVQWLSEEDLGAKGLSSGVKKVFKLFTQNRDTAKKAKAQSIARFFKPAGGGATKN